MSQKPTYEKLEEKIKNIIFLTKKQAEFKDVTVEYDESDEVIFLNVDKTKSNRH